MIYFLVKMSTGWFLLWKAYTPVSSVLQGADLHDFHLSGKTSVAVIVQLLCGVRLCDPVECSTPGSPVLHYSGAFSRYHLVLCHPMLLLPSIILLVFQVLYKNVNIKITATQLHDSVWKNVRCIPTSLSSIFFHFYL